MGEVVVVDTVTKALIVIGGGVSAFLAIGIAVAFIVVKADIKLRLSLLAIGALGFLLYLVGAWILLTF